MKTMIKLVSGLLVSLLLIGVGAYLAVGPLSGILPGTSSSHVENRSVELVESITREQQVVLLSLGIEGTEERSTTNEKFYGLFEVPGTSRSKFVKYEFTVKLGIEGGEVRIKEIGDKKYLVTLPKFVFLGHDDVQLSLASEKNGALSWATPELEDLEIANSILGDESRSQYIEDYQNILRDQASLYYRQIVTGIDPQVTLEFEFAE